MAQDAFLGKFGACIALGMVLVAINVYSSRSSYEAVGDFGWFYGDFFITGDAYTQHLCYTGVTLFSLSCVLSEHVCVAHAYVCVGCRHLSLLE